MADNSENITFKKSIVLQFNQAINNGDVGQLELLMTNDHLFVDSGHNIVKGIEPCLKALKGFFKLFPDYRNHFESIEINENVALMRGHSTCADKRLEGPALWKAEIRKNKIARWQVYEITADGKIVE